jgi:magnesium-transporting ATPase (P-type)
VATITPEDPSASDWHARPADEVLASMEGGRQGLTTDQAAGRLLRHGRNVLPPARKRGPFMRFLLQFHNVLIYVLLAAAVVTALLGHWVDSGVILGVVVINAFIGFIQEGKAEAALEAIRGMLSPHAQVLRDGHRREIDAAGLVPGDIVFLVSGDRVPADLRLVDVKSLRIEEAALTGESVAVEKQVELVDADASLGDRASMAWSGTLVAYGQGTGVVTATGGDTEIGRISTASRVKPPASTSSKFKSRRPSSAGFTAKASSRIPRPAAASMAACQAWESRGRSAPSSRCATHSSSTRSGAPFR